MMTNQIIKVKTLPIRLGQFLKLSNAAQDGHEAKYLIHNRDVLVNGHIEEQRGKQLFEGDIVQVGLNHFFTIKGIR